MADLAALLSRIEAAEGPDRELDAEIALALNDQEGVVATMAERGLHVRGAAPGSAVGLAFAEACPRYTASLDACAELEKRALPKGTFLEVSGPVGSVAWSCRLYTSAEKEVVGIAPTEALARLAALVRALIDQRGGETEEPPAAG